MIDARQPKRRRLSPPEPSAHSLPGFAHWNLEQDYEQRKRKGRKKLENNHLPIKKDGKVEANPRIAEDTIEHTRKEEKESSKDGEDTDTENTTLPSEAITPQQPSVPHKEEVRQAKEELARIAALISESPEEHVAQLKHLAQISKSPNATVAKLALATQLAVFKDIIPGYRIRPLSREVMDAKVSKDVRKLRDFEQGLLASYREYVQELDALAKRRRNEQSSDLSSVAISCSCSLLTSAPHFNMRNELVAILVRKMSARKVDTDFIRCRQALERLFQEDEEGNVSLEVVNQLTKVMKTKDFAIHESVLNTFLHLRLLSEFVHKASTNRIDKDQGDDVVTNKKLKQKKEFRTKRERKLLRERKDVAKEMKVADAAVSYEERDENQAKTLKLVFVAYFRILKARTPHLMGAVLEGLAKYAHLINQDFFGDILEVLKDLISDMAKDDDDDEVDIDAMDDEDQDQQNSESRKSTRETLLCIITAFALLQGQHDVAKSANGLHLDLSFFTTSLYQRLLPLAMDQDLELSAKTTHLNDPNGLSVPGQKNATVNVATTAVILLKSLQAILLPASGTKMVPPVRVAAFVKQLMTLSLHLPQKSAMAVLGLLQQVSKVHGKKIVMLWSTEERKGDGVFNALAGEADSSNPFASTVWEGELLRSHFDPRVRSGVEAMEKSLAESR